MRSIISSIGAVLVVALAVSACGKSGSDNSQAAPGQATTSTTTTSATPASGDTAAVEARKTFDTVCAACHGADGKGDGPGAAALEPKPRNYTDKAWQGSVTDEQIEQVITMGGAAVGKSPAMPAQPQLKNKPDVLNELVRIIRGFGA